MRSTFNWRSPSFLSAGQLTLNAVVQLTPPLDLAAALYQYPSTAMKSRRKNERTSYQGGTKGLFVQC
jgi:hypothetical protein